MTIKENPCKRCSSYKESRVCECNELINYRSYQEGRLDAITECIEMVKRCYTCEIIMKLEQLKEKKND